MKECIRQSDKLKTYYFFFSGDNCGIQDANIFFRKLSSANHMHFKIFTEYTKSSLVNLLIDYEDMKHKVSFNSYVMFNVIDKTLIAINKEEFELKYQIK